MDASQWDHQVAALSDRYRCLRPDFWGCAGSPAPPPGGGLDGFAGQVLELLDGLGVNSFSVVGLSLGGYIALAILGAAPERIRSLVLADTRAAADSDAARAVRRGVIEAVRSEGVETLVESTVDKLLAPAQRIEAHIADPVRGRVRRWTVEGIVAAQRAMADRPDRSGLLATLTRPALVVCGSEDSSTEPDSMRKVASAIPGADFQLIDGAGHLSNLEKPFAFTKVLENFLSRL